MMTMKLETISTLLASTCMLVALVPAAAQTDAPTAEPSAVHQLQTRAQELETKLRQLAAEAERKDPELIEKRSELIEMFESKLDEQGYPDREEQEKLQSMQQRLQNPEGLDDAQRMELTQEFQEKIMEMREAERKVREDREFREEQKALIEDRSEAMAEINPEAPKLEQELEQLYVRMTEMMKTDSQPVPGEP